MQALAEAPIPPHASQASVTNPLAEMSDTKVQNTPNGPENNYHKKTFRSGEIGDISGYPVGI